MIKITNISEYACDASATVRNVLERINASPYLFQIVVDADGHLVGTITDGDIRRGMLQNLGIDDLAKACVQSRPSIGKVGDPVGNRTKLLSIGSTRSFLPILDDEGVVQEILVDAGGPAIGHAVVMAGGYGRRLGERTRNTPKPLLIVGGKPMLEHVLNRLESAGIGKIHVSVHYLAEQIQTFVESRTNKSDIQVLKEEQPCGTAGALSKLVGNTHSPLLVVNADVITSLDVAALHEFHERHNLDGTVGVARYDVEIPFGVIQQTCEGMFEAIEEKPCISKFIAAGVYYLSLEFLNLVPDDRPMDMPELLNEGKKIGLKIGLFPIHEYWTDVGRPDDLDSADNWVRDHG